MPKLTTQQAKILIVDDEELSNRVVSDILLSAGYEKIKGTTNPLNALDLYRSFQPDLVILDWMMPGLSGLEVLKQLRAATPDATYLPILVVTADIRAQSKHNALTSGATDFLSKPYDSTEIVLRVHNLIETRSLYLQLQEQKQQLQAVLDHAPWPVFMKDREGRYLLVSRECERLVGLPIQKILGKTDYELLPKEAADLFQAEDRRVLEAGSPVSLETTFPHPDGIHTYTAVKFPLVGSDTKPYAICGICTDITERKRAEEALRESEERFRQFAEHVETASVWMSNETLDRLAYLSPPFEKIWGIAREVLYNNPLSFLDMVHPEDRQAAQTHLENIKDGANEVEYRIVRPDGAIRWIWDRSFPIRDASGKILRLAGIGTDITDRKQAEEAVRFHAHILDHIAEAVIATDPSGRILYVNRFAEKLYGWSSEEVIGKDVIEVTTPLPSREQAGEIMERLRRGENWSGDFLVRRRDGTAFDTHVTNTPLLDERGKIIAIVGISSDVTERKQAEKLLRDQKEFLQSIFDRIPVMISFYDKSGIFQMANQEWVRVLGWTAEEMRAHPDMMAEFYPDSEERQRVVDFMQNPNGEWADFSTRVRSGEIRRTSWTNIRLANGTLIGIGQDITDRTEHEEALRAAKHEAERANRAKSEFLSRMSHELRTPLNAILGFAQILEMDMTAPEDAESVQQILKAGQHLLELINEVLDISRIEAGRLALSIEPVAIREVMEEALGLVRPLAASRNVQLHSAECAKHVLADRQRLKQVFLNLLTNAIKYNREGGSVAIRVNETSIERLQVSIRDTGQGISNEDLPKLFVPFERLREFEAKTEGAGLGLAITKRLVELMGGEISVESTLGVGSTFSVQLPLADSTVERLERSGDLASGEPGEVSAPKFTLLYIEDNLSNLRLIERILAQRPGIRLLAAMQGRVGLELAREHTPELILLDLHLPDINGDAVLEQLLKDQRTATIPVVMLSADATPSQIERLKAIGAREYLTKPLDVRRFMAMLDEITRGAGD